MCGPAQALQKKLVVVRAAKYEAMRDEDTAPGSIYSDLRGTGRPPRALLRAASSRLATASGRAAVIAAHGAAAVAACSRAPAKSEAAAASSLPPIASVGSAARVGGSTGAAAGGMAGVGGATSAAGRGAAQSSNVPLLLPELASVSRSATMQRRATSPAAGPAGTPPVAAANGNAGGAAAAAQPSARPESQQQLAHNKSVKFSSSGVAALQQQSSLTHGGQVSQLSQQAEAAGDSADAASVAAQSTAAASASGRSHKSHKSQKSQAHSQKDEPHEVEPEGNGGSSTGSDSGSGSGDSGSESGSESGSSSGSGSGSSGSGNDSSSSEEKSDDGSSTSSGSDSEEDEGARAARLARRAARHAARAARDATKLKAQQLAYLAEHYKRMNIPFQTLFRVDLSSEAVRKQRLQHGLKATQSFNESIGSHAEVESAQPGSQARPGSSQSRSYGVSEVGVQGGMQGLVGGMPAPNQVPYSSSGGGASGAQGPGGLSSSLFSFGGKGGSNVPGESLGMEQHLFDLKLADCLVAIAECSHPNMQSCLQNLIPHLHCTANIMPRRCHGSRKGATT